VTIQSFSHVALRVSELERSLRFYRDGLGFREVSRIELEGGPTAQMLNAPQAALSAIFLERDGTMLELQQLTFPDRRELSTPDVGLGWSHIGLRVADVGKVAEELCALGGHVIESSRYQDSELGSHVLFVSDPDGARVELIELPGDPGQMVGAPSVAAASGGNR
jgi:lactoylglutathione lyase